jgi:hypothetical protein
MCRVVSCKNLTQDRWFVTLGCGHKKITLEPWSIGTLTQCFLCKN